MDIFFLAIGLVLLGVIGAAWFVYAGSRAYERTEREIHDNGGEEQAWAVAAPE